MVVCTVPECGNETKQVFVRVARSDLIGPEYSHGIAIRIACKFCEEYEGRRPDPFYLYLVNDSPPLST